MKSLLALLFVAAVIPGCAASRQWYKPGASARQVMVDSEIAFLAGSHFKPTAYHVGYDTIVSHEVASGIGPDHDYYVAYLRKLGYKPTPMAEIPPEGRVPVVVGPQDTKAVGEEAGKRYAAKGPGEALFMEKVRQWWKSHSTGGGLYPPYHGGGPIYGKGPE